jgi:hypothetical protein
VRFSQLLRPKVGDQQLSEHEQNPQTPRTHSPSVGR